MSEVFGMPLTGDDWDADEMVTDVVVIAKVIRMGDSDNRPAIRLLNNAGLDWITQVGMVQIAAEIVGEVVSDD